MDDEDTLLAEVWLHLEPLADLICCLRVLSHHEEERIALHALQGVALLTPLLDPGVQFVAVTVCGILRRILDVAREFAEDGPLNDAVLHRLGDRVVDDDLLEQGAVRVLRRGGEVELGP